MTLRRWESWVVYVRAGAKIGERRLRRHLTRKGARRWGESIVNRPDVLAATLGSALRPDSGGHMIFAEADVRARSPRK